MHNFPKLKKNPGGTYQTVCMYRLVCTCCLHVTKCFSRDAVLMSVITVLSQKVIVLIFKLECLTPDPGAAGSSIIVCQN